MNIHSFVFNPFYENTYVVSGEDGRAIIIDPGCYEDFEIDHLVSFMEKNDLTPLAIVNTHCHIDHVLGNWALKKKFGVKLWVPQNEEEILRAIPSYAPAYGFTGYQPAEVDEWYEEGTLAFGSLKFQAIEVPGHSPGHMVLYSEKDQTLIGGDVLFKGSIGRTDLPGGNHEQLLTNIKDKVYALPEAVKVYPGHGETTTVGDEKKYNPFVKG